jgi:hypothetical protein
MGSPINGWSRENPLIPVATRWLLKISADIFAIIGEQFVDDPGYHVAADKFLSPFEKPLFM